MDWIDIMLAGAVGFLIGNTVAKIYCDILYKKLIKANLDFLKANIALYKKFCAIYLDPVRDALKESNKHKRDGND